MLSLTKHQVQEELIMGVSAYWGPAETREGGTCEM